MIRVWFFSIPDSKTLFGFIWCFILGSLHSSIFGANSFTPFDSCSCLTIYLFPFSGLWEPNLKGKGVITVLASSGCTGVSWGSGFSLPALCQGDLWREMRVHRMVRQPILTLSGCWLGTILVVLPLGDLLYSRRNRLNKKVKYTWPKD